MCIYLTLKVKRNPYKLARKMGNHQLMEWKFKDKLFIWEVLSVLHKISFNRRLLRASSIICWVGLAPISGAVAYVSLSLYHQIFNGIIHGFFWRDGTTHCVVGDTYHWLHFGINSFVGTQKCFDSNKAKRRLVRAHAPSNSFIRACNTYYIFASTLLKRRGNYFS